MRSITTHDLDTLAANVVRLDDLGPVLDGWAARGIRPVALKGLALLRTIYADDLGARPMSDLDLLVAPERLVEAEEVLLDLGYSRVPHHQHTFVGGRGDIGRGDIAGRGGIGRRGGVRGCGTTRIDLASDIWYLDPPALRGFIERAAPVGEDGARLCVPDLEDHLLFVAIHAVVMHGHLRPSWREDLRRLVAERPCWDLLVERARRVRLTVPLHRALARTHTAGVDIPAEVLAELAPRGSDRVVARILDRFLDRPETHETGHLLRLLCRDGVSRKCGALYRHLFPGLDFIERRYGTRSRRTALAHGLWRPANSVGRTVRYAWRTIGAPRLRRGVAS